MNAPCLKRLPAVLSGWALVTTLGVHASTYFFNADSTGSFSAGGPPPPAGANPVQVDIDHPNVAIAAPLPFVLNTLVAHEEVDFTPTLASPPGPPEIANGIFTFTAAGGDQLQGTFAGILVPTSDPAIMTAPCTFQFGGGTGMFAGATCGGNLQALIIFTDPAMLGGDSAIKWVGTLTLVPEPTQWGTAVGLGLLAVAAWRRRRD